MNTPSLLRPGARFDESRERWLLGLVSPTWLLATRLKRTTSPAQRSEMIERLNRCYLMVSVCSVVFEAAFPVVRSMPFWFLMLWGYFLASRCTEVFAAFLMDAKDHLNGAAARSTLPYGTRLSLALRSYLELMCNFALLYYLLPADWWKPGSAPTSLIDCLYFSGVTITTTGYGDILPLHWLPRLLCITEVYCGVLLLVVCFTIYTSRALSRIPPATVSEDASASMNTHPESDHAAGEVSVLVAQNLHQHLGPQRVG